MHKTTAVLLHFVPGVAIALVYLAASPFATRAGIPRVAVLLGAFALIGIPLQLGLIAHFSRAADHSLVTFNARMPIWQYIAGAIVLIGIEFLLIRIPLPHPALPSLPIAFTPAADDDLATTSRRILLPVLVLQLLIDGIINPIIEERYFRGFLLPQLASWRIAAPIANTMFFALAHFWQPHNYISIFVYVLPLTLFTWWRRNYYVQAFVHCFANSFGATLALVVFFR